MQPLFLGAHAASACLYASRNPSQNVKSTPEYLCVARAMAAARWEIRSDGNTGRFEIPFAQPSRSDLDVLPLPIGRLFDASGRCRDVRTPAPAKRAAV